MTAADLLQCFFSKPNPAAVTTVRNAGIDDKKKAVDIAKIFQCPYLPRGRRAIAGRMAIVAGDRITFHVNRRVATASVISMKSKMSSTEKSIFRQDENAVWKTTGNITKIRTDSGAIELEWGDGDA